MNFKITLCLLLAALCLVSAEDKKEEKNDDKKEEKQDQNKDEKKDEKTEEKKNITIPDYITPCDVMKDFDSCVKKQIEISLPHFTKGIPELGVPSIDPVDLDNIKIDGNGLKLLFTEAKMLGLSSAKLSDFKINLLEEKFSLSFRVNITVAAKYVVDGQILILPIKGKGDAVVKARNIEVFIKSKVNVMNESDGQHLKLNTPSYTYKIEKTTFKFQNLFNGNKQLSDATHQFANENWKQIMDDLAPPAVKQIVRTTIRNINKFFAKVTVPQIMIGYDELRRSNSTN
ncbi:circadian clock-controlled protein daywake [Plutella xylostella]|uniref:circadian clock-controlled protein daywake n=1 Tax=Plutella xylostella TaxID=51655 RepID=UPI0020329389|nr:circadian clock-controlled protein daywake [Plutella xylostella]